MRKSLHVDAGAGRVAVGDQFAADLVGLDRVLGVQGPALAFAFGGTLPLKVEPLVGFAGSVVDLERELLERTLAGLAAGDQPFEDRVDHGRGVGRHGDGDSQRFADPLVLSEQHLEHDSVDRGCSRRRR